MANEKNLVPLTTKKAREIGRKGGKASGEAKKRRKTLKEELLALLSDGNTQNQVSLALIQKAMTGDVRAFEVLRDTIGESPKVQIEVEQETSEQDELTQALKGIADGLNKGGK